MLIQTALNLTPFDRKVRLAILGSTGSIGTSTLEVARNNPQYFTVHTLVAGSNSKLLSEQVAEFKPRYAALADKNAVPVENVTGCEIVNGTSAICDLVQHPDIDLVVAAISGNFGVASTIAAVRAGKRIALANKESLICAGSYLGKLLQTSGASIIPVDSEHSALFQALQGEHISDIQKLIITASGGPFLNTPIEQFENITPQQALKHPRWSMGAKVSIDSATLVNKSLELMEAYWLFGVSSEQIEVVVHPQSIIHSIVSYCDGTQIAQLSETSMLGPIAYALSYPANRLKAVMPQLDLVALGHLNFVALDQQKFPAVDLARQCVKSGALAQTIYSVANEVAVRRFLNGQAGFTDIYRTIASSLDRHNKLDMPTLEQLDDFITQLDRQIEQDL